MTAGILVLAMLLVFDVGASASSDRGRDVAAEHRDQVISFWTAERVRNATPRELSVAPPRSPQAKPSWAGGGGGSDDDGSTSGWTTTGASWEQGGLVKATTGKVFFVLKGTTYVCSASVVREATDATDEDLVLTAGHCVHDGDGNTWASNWLFVPDYDSAPVYSSSNNDWCQDTRYGCWVATKLTTTTGWANNGDFDDDAGFAVVGAGTKASADLSTAVGGEHGISFATSSRTLNAYAFGYPHADPYDGSDLVYCAGGTKSDPYGYDTRGLPCEMTGGSSGGPWYLADAEGGVFDQYGVGTAISVNSYKYRSGRYSKDMYGPVFGAPEQAAYTLADGGSDVTGAVITTLP